MWKRAWRRTGEPRGADCGAVRSDQWEESVQEKCAVAAHELLAHREKINMRLQSILDTHTAPWGVKVVNVEVKQVDLPESMLRAMAKQAEAEREKRSKIIHAEGEFSAAQRLLDAARLLAEEPVSIQLRYLQTLTEIGVEKNTTLVFPVPVDIFSHH